MPLAEAYRKQAALLIRIVPLVAQETIFAQRWDCNQSVPARHASSLGRY